MALFWTTVVCKFRTLNAYSTDLRCSFAIALLQTCFQFFHTTHRTREFFRPVCHWGRDFFTFCETYYHQSDCSKLIVCHTSVCDWNSVCHWAGCVEESFPSYVDLDHVWKNVAYIKVRLAFLIRITQNILFGHRCANGFWEWGKIFDFGVSCVPCSWGKIFSFGVR